MGQQVVLVVALKRPNIFFSHKFANRSYYNFACAGLGSNVDDICGMDWASDGGDHGDPGRSFLFTSPPFCAQLTLI